MNFRRAVFILTSIIAIGSALGYLVIRYKRHVWSLPLCQRESCAVAKFHGVLLKIPRSYTYGPIEYDGDEFWAGKLTQPNTSRKELKNFAIALSRGTMSPIVDANGHKRSPKDNYDSWISILFENVRTLESLQPFQKKISQLCDEPDSKSKITMDSLTVINCRGRYAKIPGATFWNDMNIYYNESQRVIILEKLANPKSANERTVRSCVMYLPASRLNTILEINFSCDDIRKWSEMSTKTNEIINFFITN